MSNRAIVLDANILIRGVLGHRVRGLLERYSDSVMFFVPESAYWEAEEHLGTLIRKRGGDAEAGLALLRALAKLGEMADIALYGAFEAEARKRLGTRDPDDWPILACALALGCPIWTEDTDFFGCGVATWTSNRIEMFLSS